MLAKRVQDGIERGEERNKKKGSEKGNSRALKVLTGSKAASASDSTGGSDDDEALLKGSKHGDLMSRPPSAKTPQVVL